MTTPRTCDKLHGTQPNPRMDAFADLLPPLSGEEFSALKADIAANGVLHPVFVDEDGTVLDGRHRLSIDPNAKRKIVRGLTPAEKEAFVFRANFVRRNLSPEQKAEARRKMKATAAKLRAEDKRKWTQKRVAEALGVHPDTVSGWFINDSEFRKANNGHVPDARAKLQKKHKELIAARVEAGETQKQVAADLGITQGRVSQVANAERKQAEAKEERKIKAAAIKSNCGVIHGDFRIAAPGVDSDSIDLILTDPPYADNAVKLYGELG